MNIIKDILTSFILFLHPKIHSKSFKSSAVTVSSSDIPIYYTKNIELNKIRSICIEL